MDAERLNSIVLVGMMGSGKSTVGRIFAARYGVTFIDADETLERRLGVSIPMIFAAEGEEGFREREARLWQELLGKKQPAVELRLIAAGGGVVLRAENRQLLRRAAVVAYLAADIETLWERLKHDRTRPLLQVADPRARLEALWAERDALYREVADVIIAHSGQRPALVAEQLARALKDFGVPLKAGKE